ALYSTPGARADGHERLLSIARARPPMMTNSAMRSLRVWDGTGSPQFGQYTADLEVRRRWTIGDGSRAARKAAEASPSRPVADAGGICVPKGSLRLRVA